MFGKKRRSNPTAFIAIGICYIGAGIALGVALENDGSTAIGISITAIGIIFVILGVVNRQKGSSVGDKK